MLATAPHSTDTQSPRHRRTSCRAWRRLSSRPRSRGGRVELLRDRRRSRGWYDLVVVATTAQIDHVCVVRIAQDPREVTLVQALAVSPEDLERFRANIRCAHRGIAVLQPEDRAPNEVERFIARQPLTRGTNGRPHLVLLVRRGRRWYRRSGRS